jgi:hypothetical protein
MSIETSWLHKLAHRMGLNEIVIEQIQLKGHTFLMTRCAVCRSVEKIKCHSHNCQCRKHRPEEC